MAIRSDTLTSLNDREVGRRLARVGALSLLLYLLSAAPTVRASDSYPTETAQDEARRRYIPVVSARHTYLGPITTPPQDAGEDMSLESHVTSATVRLGHMFRDAGLFLMGGLNYDHLLLREPAANGSSTPLHRIGLRLALGGRVAEGWSLMAMAGPSIASDMRGFAERDLRLSLGALVRYRHRPGLTFGVGAVYNLERLLPVVRVQYRMQQFRLLVGFPQGVELWFAPHHRVEVGFSGRLFGGTFGVHGASALGDRVSGLYVTVGPALRVFVHRGLYLLADGGWAVSRLRLFSDGRETHSSLDFGGSYASLTFGYML